MQRTPSPQPWFITRTNPYYMDRLKRSVLTPVLAVSLFAGGAVGVAALASAQTPTTTTTTQHTAGHMGMAPGVMGKVTAVSGNTITVAGGKDGATAYTVDVTNAKVMIGSQTTAPTTGSVSDIKVGDTVAVRGTVSGTTVTATSVTDGMFMRGGFGGPGGKGRGVEGTVSAVSGNTVTVTAKDGTSYTIDASSAKVSKVVDLQVSDIKVGDTIGAQGTVSGTSVTATHIMDGVPRGSAGAIEKFFVSQCDAPLSLPWGRGVCRINERSVV